MDNDARALVDKTHEGFAIRCLQCSKSVVIVKSDVGFSAESGGWGGVHLECLACGASTEIWSA